MASKKILDVCGKRKIFFTIPIVVAVVALIVALIFGVEVAIEFRGGTLLTYSYTGEINTNDIDSTVEAVGLGSVNITTGSAFGSDLETFNVSFTSASSLTSDNQYLITEALETKFADNNIDLVNSQDVKPSTGSTFFLKCLVAVLFSFVLLVVYIAFRFKKIGGWSAGVFALVALMHDVIMVVCVFIFFRLSIDANFMAVILTILGCSINNTIVIYDRVRENRNIYGKKLNNSELVNQSVTQTMGRTINTTLTTAFTVLVICIVAWICGVNSIISFAFPMMIGLLCGAYSSILISGPLWVLWQDHKLKKAADVKAAKKNA